ncbi:MAG: ABC transporter substrate-binding protein [Alphaproteobacteria bacterium]|jgi:peptide/nickel transport system substrate-binding protein|nr:ABC transporter substrate-binding protein [Alphaproteobacteria bacterium]MBT4020438.1 ABC transporter substrate-binding protein [Alphaproteobacteria bacterium]MBT5159772.1 ABC transporter substrate-binding protein [Alphaproteobacteria bacterium]MBT5919109.1 ABC transporter substrate-binding protein [Alphaproteobacteria bacterium]
MIRLLKKTAVLAAGLSVLIASQALALSPVETPYFKKMIAKGKIPPVAERLPAEPQVVKFSGERSIGQHGGNIRTLIGRSKDVRYLVVWGYARLMGYDHNFEMNADILKEYKVEDGRVFTFTLRKGHKWSNGDAFTSEDFRYWWEDVANNKDISPSGPPVVMLAEGKLPTFEVLDEVTVRFTWETPNPFFLSRLAGASPLFVYRPSAYLKKFHAKYTDEAALNKKAKTEGQRNWAALHNRLDNMYKFSNPDQPTLQPWVNITRPPATRFTGRRNPYYHRIDEEGRQLPYINKIVMNQSDGKLIPAKAGAGESDLQARNLAFKDFTFLKESEARVGYKVNLWRSAKGAHLALYPNLNVNDPVWRKLLRTTAFRNALSLAVDRELINESLYFGLALEHNNTALPESPLFKEDYALKWTEFDPDKANEMLDALGLDKRDDDGIRLLPDGRPMNIIVETAGEDTEQTDVLELVHDGWAEVGIKLFTKPSQREVFRNRIFSGETLISIWGGFENGLPTPGMNPAELAPTSQQSLQWPKWGQFFETKGQAGEAPDLPMAKKLAELNGKWLVATDDDARTDLWQQMLQIHADETFTIGIVAGVMQPVVTSGKMKNIPDEAVYNWDPGAMFGIYRPDTFYYAK